ncbi:MAG: putative colanic acid biosynthesis acetyltransferase [Bacteroidales bacterium]|jgi:putative colanic acid biosynthesis acetyltransferase WcaF|nr:putative colanic acid biosynthesis acetyltransferase [Bacteroidales bacterium]
MNLSRYSEPKPYYLKYIIWRLINATLFRCMVGVFFRYPRNMLLRLFGANICLKSLIYPSCKIWAPWNLELGKYSCVGPNTELYNKAPIIIKSHCVISQGAYLCTASHDITKSQHPLVIAPIIIEDKSWIAADAFIGMGVTIGEGAVVGARAAVFKDVEPWTVVGGNPAKFIKKREIKD